MADTTTTEEPVVTSGAEEALPQEQQADTAEAPTNESTTTQTTSEGAEEALPATDDKLQSFAKGQGIEDVSQLSEREQKLLKVAYDNNASYQRNRQKASELEKTMVSEVQAEAEAQGLSDDERVLVHQVATKQRVREFWDDNPEAKEYETQMVEVLADNPHLRGDLEALYAKALLRGDALQKSKTEGEREALNQLANKQRASTPTGSAVQSGIPSGKITRQMIAEKTAARDMDWLNKNDAEIKRMMVEGTLN